MTPEDTCDGCCLNGKISPEVEVEVEVEVASFMESYVQIADSEYLDASYHTRSAIITREMV